MIAGAYGSDEWRCASEAATGHPPFLMNGTSIALYSTSWHSDQRKMFGDSFGGFGNVTKLANGGASHGSP